MADFFIDKEELEKNNQSSRDFWQAQNKQVQAKKEEYQENLDRYTVNIPQEEYEIINQTISNAENPEEESYRWASAFELQRQYGIPLQEGYQNLENINAALWGDKYTFTPKTAFKAIVDSGHLGINTVKQAGIGTQVMARELQGENVDDLLTQWEEIEKENESLYDYMDRNFAIEALKFGAQSLPFTGYVAGAGILGSLIAPGVGTAAGFTASMQQAAGLQYMQLRQAGATKANAFAFSLIDGALEAIVETSLGNVAGAMGQSALGAAGKKAALEKITANVFKRLHYNGTVKNLALKLGTEYIKENFEEGMEEVIQDLINNGTQALAAELGSYNIDGRTAQQAAKDAWENFYGGFAGSLVLGLPTSALKVRSDLKEHKKIRNLAETTPSGEMFKEAVKNSPIFEGMEEGEKLEAIDTIHKNGQAYAEEELNLRAKEYGEVLGTAENFEEENIDEETGDKIIEPEYRNSETGLLHSQNVVVSEDDGIVSGVLGVGDPTRENKNTYAEFKYTLDENNNKVTIDELKVGKTRLGLKEEIYDTFARNFPGMDIEWNAIGKVAQEWKQQFEQANPQGAKAGLKYYNSTNDIADAKTRTEVVKQMKEAYKKVGRQLTGEQAAANVAIMESLYRRLREQQDFRDRGIDTFSKYVSYTFGENIFGEGSIAEEAAQQKYGDTVRAQGGSIQRSLQDLDRDLKAIIYVTKNGDFSTFSHEMAHIARKQLTGDLLKQVEDAIGVTEGNWTRELEEKFAYGFEQFLREGKVENEALRPFYEKVAQFLVDCLTRLKNVIEMTPDIEKTYNELLSKGDNSTLAAAQKAVANEEKAHQAAELQRQRQAETQKQQEEDQKNAAAQEQAEEESEVVFDEEEKELTWEEKAAIVEEKDAAAKDYYKTLAPEKVKEAQKKMAKRQDEKPSLKMGFESLLGLPDSYEKYTTLQSKLLQFGPKDTWWHVAQAEADRLADIYKDEQIRRLFGSNSNLTSAAKEEIKETLNSPEASIQEKTQVADEAAGSSYDDLPIFQLIGELGATNLDRVEEVTTRMDNLEVAKKMFKAGKTVERIRLATGWEMGADAQWRYEIADDYKFKNNIKTNRKLKRYKAEQQEAEKKLAVYTEATEEEANKIRRKIEIAVQHGAMPEGTTFESMQQEAQNEVDMYKNLIEYDGDLDVEQSLRDFIENGVSDPDNFWDIGESFRLNQIIDNEELFNAYPQLEHYVIEFTKKRNGLSGRLNPEDKIITIYPPAAISFAAFRSTIAHEIQHAIQHIEGFAEGGSANIFKEAVKPTEMQENIMLLAGIPKDQLLNYKNHEEWKTLKEYLPEALEKDIYGLGTLEQIMDRWLNDVENGVRTIDGIYEEIQNARQDYDKYHKINGYENEKSPIEKYRSLAGEVEARNVQRRLNMSAIQRLNTLLLDTEDIDRNEQLIYRNAVEMASEEVNNKDAEYEAAVNAGDFSKARGLLKQAAAEKGYTEQSYFGEGSWAAPTAGVEKDQFTDLDALQEYVDDYGEEVNIYGIINGIQAHQEDYYFNPDRAGFHGQAASDTAQILRKLRYNKAGPDTKVTVYRAVPNDVKGNKLLAGDWVALSKNYCEEHGENRYGKDNYHIIEEEVAIKDLWQGSEDMREYGFDDGSKDVEKNVPNNRKLLEITYDENGYLIPLSQRFNETSEDIQFQLVTDPAELEKLENEPTVKAYRAMQLIDGKLYPPMSAKVNGQLRDPIELGKWERAEENPDMADNNGMFKLNKGNGKTILARYNPYFHSSPTMLNDQFSEAQTRPNLVTVEVEIPLSELNSENPYRAEKAKDTVGTKQWKAGIIQGQLTGTREVNLSRWDKPVRIVPNSEVAENIKKSFGDKNIVMPSNVVPPAVKTELEKLGVQFVNTTNKGVLTEGNNAGLHYSKVYNNNMLFQGGDPTLYGVHNLSEDSLKHVFKMGGLANPSLAVVDKEVQVHSNFGDISLITYNSLIEKKTGNNAGTYGADVYSPRYPRANRFLTDKGYNTVEELFNGVEDNGVKINLIEGLKQKIEDTSFNEKFPEYTTLPVAYLLQKGDNSFWKREASKFSNEVLEKVKAFGDYATLDTPGVQEFLTEFYKNDLYNSWRMSEVDERIKNGTATETDKSDRLAYDEAVKGSMDPETGMLNYRQAQDYLYSMQRDVRNAGKVDYLGSKVNAQNIVEYDPDFKKWAKDVIANIDVEEKLFNGYTPSGNRRYLAHTLENVSKLMKAESVRGGESMNYGMGTARAMVTPKFTTLKQIRAAKDKLTDSETFKKIKDELQEEYYWVTELLQGTMDDYDAGDYRFIEAIEKGYFDADYIRKEYKDVTMSEDDEQRIKEFVQAMKEMPTEYFETKFERPIYTNEFTNSFAAAVLPVTTDPELVKKLEDLGITVYSYNDKNDRAAVTIKALDEVNKTRNVLFQTQEELYADARTFSTWQEFMDFYETMGRPEVSPIPYDADAQWYQTTWELANKVTPEESINRSILDERYEKEGTVPTALDALFVAEIVEDDEALLDYLRTLATYDSIDLNSEEYAQVADAEEAADRERISQLQDYMKTIMYSRSWKQAMASLKAGNDPTPTDLRTIRGEMRDDFKSRDFRALYAEVTGDEKYAVAEKDKPANIMQERYAKHPERYFDIVKVDDDFTKYSPEKRKQISKAMDNADLAAKIRSGKLKMNDEVYNYIKSLDQKIKSLQKELTEQEIEAENDYKRIADAERRELLKLHDKMLIAKSKYNGTNDEITRKMNKGIRITSKYTREGQNLKANYDELFRKFSDLKNMILVDAQVEAALKRQEQIHQIKEEIGTKQQEKSRAAEEKKLRIQLVKRTMRRIDFTKIDYEDAKTIVAIQRLFEPNLLGGVNRWIGTEGPFLRGVISGILTDVEYKEQIEKYLRNNAKSSQAYMDFVKLLSETKSIEDFNKWTQKDRKAALRYLPKENWVRDLNLLKLAKEREESIDLDISTVEKQRPVYDEKTGEPKTYVGPDGEKHQATQTTFVLSYSDEIAQRVKDAIGADMFENLINVPFAEWTFEQLEELATRINGLYKQGRDQLEGKKLARKEAADAIRRNIENTVKNTGIIINDDDDDETKQRKLEKINKILGLTGSNTKGSDTSKDTGFKARMNRLLHSYNDANVLRVARILDGYDESTNVMELYRKEDNCYIAKTRSMNERAARINQVMKDNNITAADLATVIKVTVPSYDTVNPTVTQEYTIDDLLYFAAAAEDYELKDNGSYDDFAACSRNAVMYGNMFASAADLAAKQAVNDNEEVDELGNSVGLKQYIARCNARFDKVLEAAKALDPKYQVLAKAIAEDYAAQYDRMNKVSVEQFNQPVHRVKCYVPLNRLESNGDTNINKVREDLLAAMGANAFKQGVNKGMTARRVRINPLNQKPVVTGLYKTWADSVERTEHFIAYSEYVNELNRVYKSRDANFTRQFIENRYGKGMIRYIDDYINEVANPNANKVREAGAELLHTLRGRTAPAYLAWKASAIVKQGLTSPWPFMQYINPAEYLSASWKAITSKGEIYKAIRQKSVYMNNRVMDPMNDLIDEMAEYGKTKFDRFMGKQAQKGMAGLEWIDWVCVAPGWYAAYQKEYNRLCGTNEAVYQAAKERLQEENMYAEVGTSEWKTAEQIEALAQKAQQDDVETRAVQYADDITRACQPSNRAVDIAPLFKNSSEAMKAYLQFQTSLNVIWQNIKYDINYVAKKPDAVAKEQFFQITGIILGYALAGIFMNSVMDGLGGDDDKDGEKADDRLKNLVYYATTQFTDAVPMIGSELTNTMDRLITGKASYQNSGTDMTPTATKLFAILTNAKAGNWEKAAEMTAEGFGMYLGLPVSGLKEVEKLAGVGDKKPGLEVNLGKVYGILDQEQYK